MNRAFTSNQIGIMQGRLSPSPDGRIQFFPVDTWQEEFWLAREASLDCIEWVYEAETETANPLGKKEQIAVIVDAAEKSGVAVWSICADFYMKRRLVSRAGEPQGGPIDHLVGLLERASLLKIKYIVLPFVDESSLVSPHQVEGLLRVLEQVIPQAETCGIELHLETDLPPQTLLTILKKTQHHLVRANYDIGNSASLGHDPAEELRLIGSRIGSVHVKDRLRGGGTVQLGTGAADFDTCFRFICASGFQGAFILQAAREPALKEVDLAIRNRKFVENQLMKNFPNQTHGSGTT
jgi:L-ribulose-5-phosphate 3-epimerase